MTGVSYGRVPHPSNLPHEGTTVAKKTPEQIADEEARTTAFGLLRYADEYRRAAVLVMEKDSKSIVPYMLVAHSLELALKSHLRSRGTTIEAMRRIGHNLPKLHEAAMRLGMGEVWPPAADLLPTLEVLEVANDEQALRYIITGYTYRPDWKLTTGHSEGFIEALKEPCLRHTFGDEAAADMLRKRGRGNLFRDL